MTTPAIVLVDEATQVVVTATPIGAAGATAQACAVGGDPTRLVMAPRAGGSFHPGFGERVRAMVGAGPNDRLPGDPLGVLCPPGDPGAVGGYYVRRFPGPDLDAVLARPLPPATRVRVGRNIVAPFGQVEAVGRVTADNHGGNYLGGLDLDTGRPMPVERIDLVDSPRLTGQRYFPCVVAHPDTLPPELQGKDLAAERPDRSCDRFSLAVLLYAALAGGYPYHFSLLGTKLSIPQRIQGGLYVGLSKLPEKAKPPAAVLDAYLRLSDELKALFRRGLLGGPHDRPAPAEWAAELDKLLPRPARAAPGPLTVPTLGSLLARLPTRDEALARARQNWNTLAAAGLVGAAMVSAGKFEPTARPGGAERPRGHQTRARPVDERAERWLLERAHKGGGDPWSSASPPSGTRRPPGSSSTT